MQGEGPSLATSIYIPERHSGEDKLPTVLIRTPYWRALLEGVAQRMAEQGFNVIVQDVRGRYGSSGTKRCEQITDDTIRYDTIRYEKIRYNTIC